MKKTWPILLLLLLLAAPAAVQAQFGCMTNADNTISITNYTGPGGTVAIPTNINGLTVTSIGDGEDSVFAGTSATIVTIPDSVTSIDTNACAFSGLISVIISGSVTNIGDSAFADCITLTNVYLNGDAPGADLSVFENDTNATVYYLDDATGWSTNFAGLPAVDSTPQDQFDYTTNACAITITIYSGPCCGSVIIPDAINGLLVTSIETNAFDPSGDDNSYPSSVTIPSSVTSIGDNAFAGDFVLQNVTIAYGVASIGDGAFLACQSLGSITIPDTVTNLGANTFNSDSLYNITIPGSVVSIGDDAFAEETSLESVTIDDGVTSIGDGAFLACQSLDSLTIPDSVTNIGEAAFEGCYSLLSVAIPGSVVSIGDDAFNSAGLAGGVTIANGVTSIGASAFAYCGVPSITIPASVTNIGDGAFEGCTSLDSVTIAWGIISIGDSAFAECGMSSITIPASVTNIGDSAFEDCAVLTSVYFTGNAPAADASVFENSINNNIPTVYYLPGTIGWGSTFAGVPAVPWNGDFTYTTNAGAINITSYYGTDGAVFIPTTIDGLPVTSIGASAFADCGMGSITIPASVTNIGDSAFEDCAVLTSVYFTGNAPIADASVFENSINDNIPTVYYLPGTTGWGSTFAGVPAVLWNPLIQAGGPDFGVQNNQFGFNITGTTNFTVVVEACTNLASAIWTSLQTITLTNGSFYFSEPLQTNCSGRYYNLGLP